MSRQMPRPLIDKRTPAEIAEQTRELLRDNLQDYGWNEQSDGGEAGRALVGVFAHYCGLVIERINRAPEKNFLAFLDLLGNSLTPPRPAQAPLSFSSIPPRRAVSPSPPARGYRRKRLRAPRSRWFSRPTAMFGRAIFNCWP